MSASGKGNRSTTSPASGGTVWEVIITEWALASYLDLKHRRVFTRQEYVSVIRPDVVLLKGGIPPTDPRFSNSKFWGPAKLGNVRLANGFKMKWHQVGPGQVQLRLPVTAGSQKVFLCECYEKLNASYERRKLARFKTHMNLIAQGRYVYRGTL
jgi:hypothetical protein